MNTCHFCNSVVHGPTSIVNTVMLLQSIMTKMNMYRWIFYTKYKGQSFYVSWHIDKKNTRISETMTNNTVMELYGNANLTPSNIKIKLPTILVFL